MQPDSPYTAALAFLEDRQRRQHDALCGRWQAEIRRGMLMRAFAAGRIRAAAKGFGAPLKFTVACASLEKRRSYAKALIVGYAAMIGLDTGKLRVRLADLEFWVRYACKTPEGSRD